MRFIKLIKHFGCINTTEQEVKKCENHRSVYLLSHHRKSKLTNRKTRKRAHHIFRFVMATFSPHPFNADQICIQRSRDCTNMLINEREFHLNFCRLSLKIKSSRLFFEKVAKVLVVNSISSLEQPYRQHEAKS